MTERNILSGLRQIDEQILGLLRINPQWTLEKVAKEVGKSHGLIKKRVQVLQDKNLLVHGWVVSSKLHHFRHRYLVHVNLDVCKVFEVHGHPRDGGDESKVGVNAVIKIVEEAAEKPPYKDDLHIEEIYETMGHSDLLFEIFSRDPDLAGRFIVREIASISGVARTETQSAILAVKKVLKF